MRCDVDRIGLPADQRVVEFDFCFDAQAPQARPQLAVAAVFAHAHRLEHLNVTPRRALGRDAGLIDRCNERRGAAVHDGNFRAIDFDNGIVDAEAMQRSKNMFGGRYSRSGMIAKHRGKFRRRYGAIIGLELAVLAIRCCRP